jgi:hypothetical protein
MKCVGLDLANLIVFISKNGKKNLKKSQFFFSIFHLLKKHHQVAKFHQINIDYKVSKYVCVYNIQAKLTIMVSLGTGTQWKSVCCPPTIHPSIHPFIHPSIPYSAIMSVGSLWPWISLDKEISSVSSPSPLLFSFITNPILTELATMMVSWHQGESYGSKQGNAKTT